MSRRSWGLWLKGFRRINCGFGIWPTSVTSSVLSCNTQTFAALGLCACCSRLCCTVFRIKALYQFILIVASFCEAASGSRKSVPQVSLSRPRVLGSSTNISLMPLRLYQPFRRPDLGQLMVLLESPAFGLLEFPPNRDMLVQKRSALKTCSATISR